MLEVLFGVLSVLGDILAPTPAVRLFWAVFGLLVLLVIIAAVLKISPG